MIYDRTKADIDSALSIRADYVQQGTELTAEQVEQLERGTITINTLNRIENKQKSLKSLFNAIGYWNTPTTNREWQYTDIFDEANFQRIINNLDILRNAFFVFKSTPKTPPVSYNYEDINSLEKILYDLDVMINDVKSRYRRCGTFRCGEVI